MIDPNEVRFFSGSSNPELAASITEYLGLPLDRTKISRFSNDNLYIQLGASVRSRKVFIVQSLSPPVNDHLMELLMLIDIARGAAAQEIHAIIPYFSFARSDKKDAPRISITARLIADLLQTAGATHAMGMVFHSPQVHGFFRIPTDHLSSRSIFQKYFQQCDLSDTIVIAPDVGQAKAAARFAKELGLPTAAGNKERISDSEVRITGLLDQQVKLFRKAIIYDDEIATGGSVIEVSKLLVGSGIQEILVVCTHGAFVRGGLQKLGGIPEVTEIITTDTIQLSPQNSHCKLRRLSVAPIFGEAIQHNYLRRSIGNLFVYWNENVEEP